LRRLLLVAVLLLAAGAALIQVPAVRSRVRAIVRPEPPLRITPLAVSLPVASALPAAAKVVPTATDTPPPTAEQATAAPAATPTPEAPTALPGRPEPPTATPEPPTAIPQPTAIVVNGVPFEAHIPAATKPGQFFQYTCEFDAAWVILATYGIQATGEELINAVDHDTSVEPYIEETAHGVRIIGGDIENAFSGDYRKNFLARSTATAMRKLFTRYNLESELLRDRAALEAALRAGRLVWIKTTVDFKPWRPATWVMPNGKTYQTVLGNDHAVVVMGFSERGVLIRDVLGPTSTNRNRPYEYEVDWDSFMAAWGAQSFDGLAVFPPQR